jgi:hypothetical protein
MSKYKIKKYNKGGALCVLLNIERNANYRFLYFVFETVIFVVDVVIFLINIIKFVREIFKEFQVES